LSDVTVLCGTAAVHVLADDLPPGARLRVAVRRAGRAAGRGAEPQESDGQGTPEITLRNVGTEALREELAEDESRASDDDLRKVRQDQGALQGPRRAP